MKQTSGSSPAPNATSRLLGAMSLATIACRCRNASASQIRSATSVRVNVSSGHPARASARTSRTRAGARASAARVRAGRSASRTAPRSARGHRASRSRPRLSGADNRQRPRRDPVERRSLIGFEQMAQATISVRTRPGAGRRRAAVDLHDHGAVAEPRRYDGRPVHAALAPEPRDRLELAELLDHDRAALGPDRRSTRALTTVRPPHRDQAAIVVVGAATEVEQPREVDDVRWARELARQRGSDFPVPSASGIASPSVHRSSTARASSERRATEARRPTAEARPPHPRPTRRSVPVRPRAHRSPCRQAQTPGSRRPRQPRRPSHERPRPARSWPMTGTLLHSGVTVPRSAPVLLDQRPRGVLEHRTPIDRRTAVSSSVRPRPSRNGPLARRRGPSGRPGHAVRNRGDQRAGIRVQPQADVILARTAGVALVQPPDRRRPDRQSERAAAVGDRVGAVGSAAASRASTAPPAPRSSPARAPAGRGGEPARGVRRQSSLEATRAVRRAGRIPRASRIRSCGRRDPAARRTPPSSSTSTPRTLRSRPPSTRPKPS